MNKQTVKTVLRVTTQFGTGVIAGSAIASNVPQHPNPVINLTVRVAAFMIGGVAAETTGAYSDRLVDDIDEILKTGKADLKVV